MVVSRSVLLQRWEKKVGGRVEWVEGRRVCGR